MKKTAILFSFLFLAACGSKEQSGSDPAGTSKPGSTSAAPGQGANSPGGGAAVDRAPTKEFSGDEAGAKKLLSKFLEAGTDKKALTKALRPDTADYTAVFEADAAAKAEKEYAGLWSGDEAISGKEGQTELLLSSASTADFKAWNDKADNFPGGYKKIVDKIKPGVVLYRWKFVKPGEKLGMAFDGLAFVNGHWVWFPKPWRVIAGNE